MQGDSCTVTMSSDRNVTATFATVQVTLTSLTLKPSSVRGEQMSIATLTLGASAGGRCRRSCQQRQSARRLSPGFG